MDHAAHLEATRREIDALNEAVAAGPMDAPVPSCPDWVVADLAFHVGSFMGFWSHVLCDGTGRPRTPFPEAPDGEARAAWLAELGALLVGELEATDPTTKIWTWVQEDDTAAFACRRSANELAVHRFDAQLARGTQQPIEPALAEDGIREVVLMMGNRSATIFGDGETVLFDATDRGARWLLTLGTDRVDLADATADADSAARADLTLRGTASDLELVLYQRPTIGSVEHIGDEAALAAVHRAFTF